MNIDRDTDANLNTTSAESQPALPPMILLVDDDDFVREMAVQVLEDLNYRVIEASDAESALRHLKQRASEIDLLFTDIIMPGAMMGFELAELALHRHPGLKVLFATGFADISSTHVQPALSGATVLNKPYSMELLESTLGEILGTPQPQAIGSNP